VSVNVNKTDGLVNGAQGTITGFTLEARRKVAVVWVRFDDAEVGEAARAERSVLQHPTPDASEATRPSTPICPVERTFQPPAQEKRHRGCGRVR
jgi:hypothetical protein